MHRKRAEPCGPATATSPTAALGAEWREQSTVVLGRVTTRTWDRLASQVDTIPKSPTRPGRVHVVQGWTAHPTQVLLLTDGEATAWGAATAAEEG
ncbi:hypothetical protein [Streptomyces sp. NBC_00057]|uniref:hypothetical protein n=1 Tax=Streptomyces sp. NBC_00057 TaxID=2975634 RepID=UPI00386A04DA